jgi:uncharacterized protein (DUF885 family)
MSDIIELEARITSALGRIRRQVEAMGPALAAAAEPASVEPTVGVDAESVPALRSKLEEERVVNAQLEERVRALKERQDTRLAQLELQVDQSRARMIEMDKELQRLQQINAELRAVASEMRLALAEGVAEPELVNKAAMAEIEALNASKAADRAEVAAVLAELKPLVEETN